MAFASLVDHKHVKENEIFVEYQIQANSVISSDVNSGEKYEQIREAAHLLLKHTIEQKLGTTEFVAYTLFSKIQYKNGIITGQFHKDLVPFFIIANERFTKLKITEYMKLPSIYSQSMFGLLKSWDDKDEIIIKISELHTMLDTPQSFRKDFYEFKRRVLEKAHKDINEYTSLKYDWEPIKVGRSVQQIKFIFIKPQPKKRDVSPQAKALVRQALGVASPEELKEKRKPIEYDKFLKFLAKFEHKGSIYDAGQMWQRLHAEGNAPMACDVPDGNQLSPLDFLVQWKAERG